MAEVKGFNGIRYTEKAGALDALVCPPYDIIPDPLYEELTARSPYNFVRLEKPMGEDKYNKAASLYREWLNTGIFRQEDADCAYVYEQEYRIGNARKSIKGVLAAVRLEEFDKKVVLPHEFTLAPARNDRFALFCSARASFSPIYSLYRDEKGTTPARIAKWSAGEPDIVLRDEVDTVHRLWLVKDPVELKALQADFADRCLYIADGHHRYETSLRYLAARKAEEPSLPEDAPCRYTAMLLVDMENEGLSVFPTHRLVRGCENFNEDEILARLRGSFRVERFEGVEKAEEVLAASKDAQAFAFYTGGDAFYLVGGDGKETVRRKMPERSDAYCELDVSVLHTCILTDIFGISEEDMANQTRLSYTRSAAEAVQCVKKGEADCAFILRPTKVEQISAVAAAGDKMPQKSTYFYPKPLSGFVFINLS